jgi:hypothetical protein
LKNALTIERGWLGKQEAAKLLGVGIRQLENRAGKGEIRKNTLPRQPNERAARVLYSAEDIEAIKSGAVRPVARPVSQSPGAIAPRPPAADPFAGLAAHLAALAGVGPTPAPTYLTLKQAAEHSGLPARWLRAAARAGKLRAQNVGEKRERWMFPREGLN